MVPADALRCPLVRAVAGAAVGVAHVWAWPGGLSLVVVARVAPGSPAADPLRFTSAADQGGGEISLGWDIDGQPLAVQADGPSAARRYRAIAEGAGGWCLVAGQRQATSLAVDATYHLTPLPRGLTLRLTVAWPACGLDDAVGVDLDDVRSAAGRAVTLWDDPRPEYQVDG